MSISVPKVKNPPLGTKSPSSTHSFSVEKDPKGIYLKKKTMFNPLHKVPIESYWENIINPLLSLEQQKLTIIYQACKEDRYISIVKMPKS